MRLNRIESFYAFLLLFRSEGNEEEAQLGMARPHVRGGRLWPGPLQGTTACKGQQPPTGTTGCGMAPYKG
ncbi:hypothetical protein B296_00034580, partial [Ensete ventricosum]